MSSLRRQIHLGMLIAVAAAAAVLFYWGDAGIERLIRSYILARLDHDADSVVAALTRDTSGRWSLDDARLGAVYGRVYSGHYYRVFSQRSDLRSRSLWDHPVEPAMLTPGATSESRIEGPRGQQLLTWSRGIRKSDEDLTVWLAEDLGPILAAQRRYTLSAGVALAAIILMLIVAQQLILKRGFSRLDAVRSAIRDLQGGRIDTLSTDVPDEIKPLVDEVNRLLVRLEGKVSRSRNAMGSLAHELKRPLGRLRRLGERLDAKAGGSLLDSITDLEQLLERELKRARIVGVGTPGRHTALRQDIPVLVDALRRIHPGRAITTRFPPELVLPQDRDDILELIGNLLDNALKYSDGEVTLAIEGNSDHWTMEVSDHGAGIPESEFRQALERGARLDERRAGSGLGLAICSDIVREYNGTLRLANREPHGLSVIVSFDRS